MGSQRLAHSWATEHTHTTSFPTMVTFEVLRKWEKPKWYLEEANRGKVKKKKRLEDKMGSLWPPSPVSVIFFHHPRFPGLYVVQHQPLKHIWLCSRRIVDRSGTKQSADWISSSHVDYKVWNEGPRRKGFWKNVETDFRQTKSSLWRNSEVLVKLHLFQMLEWYKPSKHSKIFFTLMKI